MTSTGVYSVLKGGIRTDILLPDAVPPAGGMQAFDQARRFHRTPGVRLGLLEQLWVTDGSLVVNSTDAAAHHALKLRVGETWRQGFERGRFVLEKQMLYGIALDGSSRPWSNQTEWAYAVDLDEETFSAYVGHQQWGHSRGGIYFSGQGTGLKRVLTWYLDGLPDSSDFISAVEAAAHREWTGTRKTAV